MLRLQAAWRRARRPETLPIPQGRRRCCASARWSAGPADRRGAGRARSAAPTVRCGPPLHAPTPVAGPRRHAPLLVFFHGGGMIYGDLDSHDAVCRFLAERPEVRVLAVDYRLAPEHPFPAGVDDALAAYAWIAGTPPTRRRPGPARGRRRLGGRLPRGGDGDPRRREEGCRCLPAADLPGHRHGGERRAGRTVRATLLPDEEFMDWHRDYLPTRADAATRGPRRCYADLPRPRAGVRRDRRVRPAARRGRGYAASCRRRRRRSSSVATAG